MPKRIVYTNTDGSVGVLTPVTNIGLTVDEIAKKDVPSGRPFSIIDTKSLPADRIFRNAWASDSAGKISVDLPRAKQIAHALRREARQKAFAPFDNLATVPGNVGVLAEAQRAKIRVLDAVEQKSIASAQNEAALKRAISSNFKKYRGIDEAGIRLTSDAGAVAKTKPRR